MCSCSSSSSSYGTAHAAPYALHALATCGAAQSSSLSLSTDTTARLCITSTTASTRPRLDLLAALAAACERGAASERGRHRERERVHARATPGSSRPPRCAAQEAAEWLGKRGGQEDERELHAANRTAFRDSSSTRLRRLLKVEINGYWTLSLHPLHTFQASFQASVATEGELTDPALAWAVGGPALAVFQ